MGTSDSCSVVVVTEREKMSQQIIKPEIPQVVEQQAEQQSQQPAEEQSQQQAEQAPQKPKAPEPEEVEFNFKFQKYEDIVKQIESDAYVAKLKREFAEMDNADKKYSIQEVSEHLVQSGKFKMGSCTEQDFADAMRYVIQSDEWLGKKDTEEVDEAIFIEFFQCFYKLFYAIDRQGDQNVSVNDALKWFQKKAAKFGLDKSENMYGTVSNFMRNSGKNDDGNLTVVEFFVNLKNFREIYVEFKK